MHYSKNGETSHQVSMGRIKLLHSMIFGHYEKLKKPGLRKNMMYDQMRKPRHMLPWQRKKRSLVTLVLKKYLRIWQRFNAMDVNNMGTTRDIGLILIRTTTKEEGKKPISLKK